MAAFVCGRNFDTGAVILVNLDLVRIVRPHRDGGSVVRFESGALVRLQETPEVIRELARDEERLKRAGQPQRIPQASLPGQASLSRQRRDSATEQWPDPN